MNNFAYQDSSDTGGKGGAIFTYSGKLRVLANSLFQGNLVGESFSSTANLGGAIYSMDSYLAIYNSTFLENYAAGHGGAVYAVETPFGEMAFGGLITIQNTNFSENWALGDGGALYLKGEIEGIYAVTTSFADNIAEGQGGAIFSEDSDLSTSFSQLTNNQAENGGLSIPEEQLKAKQAVLSATTLYSAVIQPQAMAGRSFLKTLMLKLKTGISAPIRLPAAAAFSWEVHQDWTWLQVTLALRP